VTDPPRLFEALAADDSVVAEIYEAHLENNHGLLSHILMGELLSELEDSHRGVAGADLDVTAFLRSLERHYRPEIPDERGVVVTSFLLDLPWPGQPGYDIVDRLGERLRAEFDRVRPHG